MKKAFRILTLQALLLIFMLAITINIMQDIEIWKPVPNYEGYYEVSSQGRVRSVAIRKHFQPYKKRKEPLIMKFNPIKGGYLIVRLYKDGKGKDNLVSRLTLTTFEGDGPDGYECDHIDSDTSNNKLTNLRWVSPRKNNHLSRERRKHSMTSQYTGVCLSHGKWIAKIKIKGKTKYIGNFSVELEAHQAYQKVLSQLTNV